MKRYLLIAHFEGDHRLVHDLVQSRSAMEPSQFYILVPATPSLERFWTWTEEESQALAQQRLAIALTNIGATGAEVSGGIGDAYIFDAITDAIRAQPFDEIILATPPVTLTERLFGDLAARIKRIKDLPITHLVIPDAQVA